MAKLKGKKVLLGVTGGIAAYKACDLLRKLQDAGAEVRVAMTPSATDFVAPMTFAALSGFPVFLASKGDAPQSAFQHIDYPRWADALLIAPASANSIARFAGGFADEPVSQCVLASLVPKLVVPAMNYAMYKSLVVQRNLTTLRADGFHIVEPESGRLACGEEGQGRFPEVSRIVEAMETLFAAPSLGRTVLITAGRTEELIDPVRMITNRSSGKTGVAIAEAFRDAGYHVLLVHGPMDLPPPKGCEAISVTSAREMHLAVLARQDLCDAMVFCAAVADYRPKMVAEEKIKDSRSLLVLELEPNPSILMDCVKNRRRNQMLIGFALETEKALEYGLGKLQKSGADMLVVNTPVRADSGFGHDVVEFALLRPTDRLENAPQLALGSKASLAQELVNQVNATLGIGQASQ